MSRRAATSLPTVAGPPGILADQHLDALAAHQVLLVTGVEGPRADEVSMRHRQAVADRLDGAHEIAMLRGIGEGRQFQPADGQEDAAWLATERLTAASMSGTDFQRSPCCGLRPHGGWRAAARPPPCRHARH